MPDTPSMPLARWLALLRPQSPQQDARRIARLSLCITLLALVTFPVHFDADTVTYLSYARAWTEPDFIAYPLIYWRTPGYPLLMWLSGVTHLHSLLPLLLVQGAMAWAVPVLVYHAVAATGVRWAYGAAAALALSLMPVIYVKTLMTETPHLFFLMLGLWGLARYLVARQWRWLGLCAVACGWMALIRPSSALVVLVFGAALLMRPNLKKTLHGALALALFVAFMAGGKAIQPPLLKRHGDASQTGKMLFWNVYMGTRKTPLAQSGGPQARRFKKLLLRRISRDHQTRGMAPTYANYFYGRPLVAQLMFTPFFKNPEGLAGNLFLNQSRIYYWLIWDLADRQVGAVKADGYFRAVCLEWLRTHPGAAMAMYVENFLHFTLLAPRDYGYSPDPGEEYVYFDRVLFTTTGPSFALGQHPRFAREITFDPMGPVLRPIRKLLSWAWSTLFLALRPVLFLLMLGGLAAAWRRRGEPVGVLLLCCGGVALLEAVVVSVFNQPLPRYILHTAPLELLPAVLGLQTLVKTLGRRPGPKGACAVRMDNAVP